MTQSSRARAFVHSQDCSRTNIFIDRHVSELCNWLLTNGFANSLANMFASMLTNNILGFSNYCCYIYKALVELQLKARVTHLSSFLQVKLEFKFELHINKLHLSRTRSKIELRVIYSNLAQAKEISSSSSPKYLNELSSS